MLQEKATKIAEKKRDAPTKQKSFLGVRQETLDSWKERLPEIFKG